MGLTETTETELWSCYRRSRDVRARETLFAHHAPWARTIALSVHRRVWSLRIERSDCIQNATVGLLEAMDRYDPGRGIAFRAYATQRVRGAVFNGLRTLTDEVRLAAPGRVQDRLADLVDRESNDELEYFSDLVGGLGLGLLLEHAHESLVDERDAAAYTESSLVRARLLAAMQDLPERLRTLLESHYFHHLPMCELAARWGVTKGRVSQLHRDALGRLRCALHD
ncbi:sigma-70 family RNA polymerase sigma factor [Lysobacter korlensis]|uniref:Sigma-70 family RNA polymerase sigma factor n=1 Tax=Lysobacter korlensis TaxID=553636 RepID=A0ABV6RM11_9GAMM